MPQYSAAGLKKWILIVDDEHDVVNLVRTFCEMSFGDAVKFIEAFDGSQATQKLAFQAFDVIVTDLRMPNKDGRAFIQSVRESPLNNKTPIIVMSAHETDAITREFQHIHFLAKPFENNKMVDLVDAQLKLGKNTHSRIEADLLNSVMAAAGVFLQKTIDQNPTPIAPTAKKIGENLQGDLIQSFSIKAGPTINEFAIGFEKEIIETVRKKVAGDSTVEDSTILTTAGNLIVKFAIQSLGKPQISTLNSKQISKSESNYNDLLKKAGIVIPLDCELGRLTIYALWNRDG